MTSLLKKTLFRISLIVLLLLCGVWAFLAFKAWRADPLQLWHTVVPRELSVAALDAADWQAYVAHEDVLFETVRNKVTLQLPASAQTPMNRFYQGAAVYPPSLARNWNHSYLMRPEGEVRGAVVLLHGLTDCPYSLRHLARLYVSRGFAAYGLRMPGHGTVPAGLTEATWPEWSAAVRMAMREASATAGKDGAVHLVGFSTGGALALKYTLDTLEDPALPRPDRVVLLSPMIGITRLARFAGLTAVPALLPPFANAAWLSVLPEFNPFKYNSFPVNGASQSFALSTALQSQISRLSRTPEFATLPPILTFQSVLDYTVSTPAILYHLYAYLPENGSELLLYDVNQASLLGGLMRTATLLSLQRLLPQDEQRYTLRVLRNRAPGDQKTELITRPAGSLAEERRDLDYLYPPSVFSLSHGAIPFPMNDPLYGMTPDPADPPPYGVSLGNLLIRGERGALLVPMDAMLRMSSNPFFPLQLELLEKCLDDPRPPAGLPAILPQPSLSPKEVEARFEDFLKEPDSDAASGASLF